LKRSIDALSRLNRRNTRGRRILGIYFKRKSPVRALGLRTWCPHGAFGLGSQTTCDRRKSMSETEVEIIKFLYGTELLGRPLNLVIAWGLICSFLACGIAFLIGRRRKFRFYRRIWKNVGWVKVTFTPAYKRKRNFFQKCIIPSNSSTWIPEPEYRQWKERYVGEDYEKPATKSRDKK